MIAAHLRYSWCSEEALATMLGHCAPIEQLRTRLDTRALLLEVIDAQPPQSDGARRLVAWAREPCFERRPPERLIRAVEAWARKHARDDVRALATWVADILAEFEEPSGSSQSDDAGRLAFLHALGASEFPVLLLWSNATLARHLFGLDGHGRVALRRESVASHKRLRRAALSAAAYACGSMRRFAPRDAWVGVAFARQDPGPGREGDVCTESDTLARIDRRSERIALEPNLAWTVRSWRDLPQCELASGMNPWQHLRARVSRATTHATRKRYELLLEKLSTACERIYPQWLEFGAVDAFLNGTDSLFAHTVAPEVWRKDPHRWWVVRYVGHELPIPAGVAFAMQAGVESAYTRARGAAIALGLARESPSADKDAGSDEDEQPRAPLALRMAVNVPQAILARAEEPIDWIVDANAAAVATQGVMPRCLPAQSAIVAELVTGGQRFLYAEPNPRRVAERFFLLPGLAECERVAYAAFTGGLQALAPPAHLVDNRLVRLEERELDRSSCQQGDMVGFRSALVTDETMPLLHLELASKAYRVSPEPLPRVFDPLKALSVSFGRVDRDARIWLLAVDDLRRLAGALPMTRALCAYFHIEIFRLLGRPTWIEALIEGKRSAWPTSVSVSFDILANAARAARSSVAILAPETIEGAAVRNEQGDQLPAQVYFVGRAE